MNSRAVSTPHRLSAEAGRETLDAGGNAVDAAVAATAAQGVVAPETCGLGGDLFALIHAPGWDRPRALNASGRAGSNADAAALREAGLTDIPADHPAAVTIPGCVDGLIALVSELGRLDLPTVLEPATRLASDGFEVSTEQAAAFSRRADEYRENPAVADFYSGGSPVAPGDTVVRSDLARVLADLADGGRDAFYGGMAGEDVSEAVGGMITLEDMTTSQAEWVDPIAAEVAGLTAWTIPPNSQGYLGPAALAVFELLSPPDDPEDPLWWHLLIESYRCLAWERDDLVSEPETMALPVELLLNRDRLQRAADTVDRNHTGVWPQSMSKSSGTAYLCAADADDMAVSMIQSNYRGTGSPFGASRSGFLLQDRGMGFNLTPGHPNELRPGKRPLHTLAPTIWTSDNRARWVLGTRGGAVQPQLIAQVAARAILGGSDLVATQRAPRWTTSSFGPGTGSNLSVEPGVSRRILDDLLGRGHSLTILDRDQPGWGPLSVIELDGDQKRSAPDPRVDTATSLIF
ncbi:MAG TPA: gamma-glutamyltransferase [Acidimicrobiia bacterium]|nr:gamma-glutamyltransferase [Acidimicrobiia bacterium]